MHCTRSGAEEAREVVRPLWRRVWIATTEAGVQTLTHERSGGLDRLETALDTRLTAAEQQLLSSTIPLLGKLLDEPFPARVTK